MDDGTDVNVVKTTSVFSVMNKQEHALDTADNRAASAPVVVGSPSLFWVASEHNENMVAAGVMPES